MLEIKGKHNTAVCYAKVIEDEAVEQVRQMCDQEFLKESKIRIMPDVHAGKGCTIGTTMTITDCIVPNMCGVDIGCLDGDTEFLTESGFKKISDYQVGDKVLQYDPETDRASFTIPIAFINKSCDKFYHFKNSKGLDQMVSEEHRMLVYKGFKSKGYSRQVFLPNELIGKPLEKGYYNFKCSYSFDGCGVNMTDDELRLRVAVCADGRIRHTKDGKNAIEFHFKRKRKIERMRALLSSIGLQYSEWNEINGSVGFYISGDTNDISLFEKTFDDLYTASRHQLEVITEECLLWDGHLGYRSSFSSTNKAFADFIQFAFSGTNTRAGMSIYDSKNDNWKTIYAVTPTKNEYVAFDRPRIIEKKGMRKYCFIVPSSYFVIRRNGKMAITGNCGMLAVALDVNNIDFKKVDEACRYIPSGMNVWDNPQSFDLTELRCYDKLKNLDWLQRSLGTLGGGKLVASVQVNSL